MLCTFTLAHGDEQARELVIRSETLIEIQDLGENISGVRWLVGEVPGFARVIGTARENKERIQQEELDTIARVNDHQQRQQQRMGQGLPAMPVPRGKQAR